MLVGIAVFPITWIVLSVLLADDWEALGLFLLFAVSGFAGLWALETAPERPHGDGLAGGTGGTPVVRRATARAPRPAGDHRPAGAGQRAGCVRGSRRVRRTRGCVPAGVGTGSGVGHDE